ncbi:MBL fold metallo-hydrolase [Streptomyces chiangmaiensis]|uniref:MBL fold metallo-hydrolase n=1 Tax=Streptomyces chiangmaiensis TaxID=766497 RepID=A0ABU7FSW2_9ACTN|nr:MBL fold metallo-hydrolase [Streptomyces chiangmaiensis]MED7827205.1 MBL fold metallo-hydrolase [Streptomyces chiangmaiensis]
MASDLRFHVHVADPTPEHGTPPVPHGHPSVASPMSSTLITGERDAVLVDTPWTHEHIRVIGNWIASFEKNLTAIYITHGHGDHWFGVPALLDRFPGATVYSTAAATAGIRKQQETRGAMWDARFPGQVCEGEVHPEIIPEHGIELEGNVLKAVELGHTDTDGTTGLWAPSIRLFVAGDSVYNHCHQYLNESGNGGLDAWYRALDTIEALEPTYAVAGHKDKTQPDDAGAVQRTRTYLSTFQRLADEGTRTPEEFFDEMMRLFPGYANPKALWRSVVAVIGPPTAG